jgi:hypothetical protein
VILREEMVAIMINTTLALDYYFVAISHPFISGRAAIRINGVHNNLSVDAMTKGQTASLKRSQAYHFM